MKNDPFTMSDYIKENGLGVNLHDAGATKQIAKHLRKNGYRSYRGRLDGKVRYLWTKKPIARENLAAKLKGLK